MAVEIIDFEPKLIQNGSAYDFRSNININFQNIKVSLDSIKNNMVNIAYGPDQPVGQKEGDFWFRVIS